MDELFLVWDNEEHEFLNLLKSFIGKEQKPRFRMHVFLSKDIPGSQRPPNLEWIQQHETSKDSEQNPQSNLISYISKRYRNLPNSDNFEKRDIKKSKKHCFFIVQNQEGQYEELVSLLRSSERFTKYFDIKIVQRDLSLIKAMIKPLEVNDHVCQRCAVSQRRRHTLTTVYDGEDLIGKRCSVCVENRNGGSSIKELTGVTVDESYEDCKFCGGHGINGGSSDEVQTFHDKRRGSLWVEIPVGKAGNNTNQLQHVVSPLLLRRFQNSLTQSWPQHTQNLSEIGEYVDIAGKETQPHCIHCQSHTRKTPSRNKATRETQFTVIVNPEPFNQENTKTHLRPLFKENSKTSLLGNADDFLGKRQDRILDNSDFINDSIKSNNKSCSKCTDIYVCQDCLLDRLKGALYNVQESKEVIARAISAPPELCLSYTNKENLETTGTENEDTTNSEENTDLNEENNIHSASNSPQSPPEEEEKQVAFEETNLKPETQETSPKPKQDDFLQDLLATTPVRQSSKQRKSYMCNFCPQKKFRSRNIYDVHMRNCHKKCNCSCNQYYETRDDYLKHFYEVFPLACLEDRKCPDRFRRLYFQAVHHRDDHYAERPYYCIPCCQEWINESGAIIPKKFRFKDLNSLRIHAESMGHDLGEMYLISNASVKDQDKTTFSKRCTGINYSG